MYEIIREEKIGVLKDVNKLEFSVIDEKVSKSVKHLQDNMIRKYDVLPAPTYKPKGDFFIYYVLEKDKKSGMLLESVEFRLNDEKLKELNEIISVGTYLMIAEHQHPVIIIDDIHYNLIDTKMKGEIVVLFVDDVKEEGTSFKLFLNNNISVEAKDLPNTINYLSFAKFLMILKDEGLDLELEEGEEMLDDAAAEEANEKIVEMLEKMAGVKDE